MVPTEQKDLNALYVNEMSIINSKPPKEEAKVNPEQKQEDYYKVSRVAFRWDSDGWRFRTLGQTYF